MRFLSFGAGVQTTALLLMDSYDEVIFADTGAEKQETYDYITKYVRPYCDLKEMPFTVVKAKRTLEEYCRASRNVPSIKYRWSTRDYKIRPMQRYIKNKYKNEMPVRCAIGISTDEIGRANTRNPKEWNKEYPLIEKRFTRKDCAKFILDKGFPLPEKSGCYFCPFQRISVELALS